MYVVHSASPSSQKGECLLLTRLTSNPKLFSLTLLSVESSTSSSLSFHMSRPLPPHQLFSPNVSLHGMQKQKENSTAKYSQKHCCQPSPITHPMIGTPHSSPWNGKHLSEQKPHC